MCTYRHYILSLPEQVVQVHGVMTAFTDNRVL